MTLLRRQSVPRHAQARNRHRARCSVTPTRLPKIPQKAPDINIAVHMHLPRLCVGVAYRAASGLELHLLVLIVEFLLHPPPNIRDVRPVILSTLPVHSQPVSHKRSERRPGENTFWPRPARHRRKGRQEVPNRGPPAPLPSEDRRDERVAGERCSKV